MRNNNLNMHRVFNRKAAPSKGLAVIANLKRFSRVDYYNKEGNTAW